MEKVLTPSSGEERELVKKKKTHWEKAGMSREQWLTAVKFDSTDWGWVIMSIGMAIGAGIVFLPVQVGLAGIWIYLIVIYHRLSGYVLVPAAFYQHPG